jgi:hypothetical protein
MYTSNPEHTKNLDGPGQSGIETTHQMHQSVYTSNPEIPIIISVLLSCKPYNFFFYYNIPNKSNKAMNTINGL